jgi:hypothetical protein
MSITNSELRKKPGTAASIAKYPFIVSPLPIVPILADRDPPWMATSRGWLREKRLAGSSGLSYFGRTGLEAKGHGTRGLRNRLLPSIKDVVSVSMRIERELDARGATGKPATRSGQDR